MHSSYYFVLAINILFWQTVHKTNKKEKGEFSSMPCTILNIEISHVGANGNVLCLYQLCYDSLDVLQVTFGCCVFVGVSATLYSKNTKTVLMCKIQALGENRLLSS